MSELLVDGFFPHCQPTDRPQRQRASGFREIGLPFESDTAITRHLAAFLQAHGEEPGEPVRPTHVLFNGGVFKAEALQGPALGGAGPMVRAANRRRGCLRASTTWTMPLPAGRPITAGRSSAAACASAAAPPGRITWASKRRGWPCRARRGRCGRCAWRPIGMEEGTEAEVPSDEIGLVVGEPAHFRFFSSSVRKADRPGDLLSAWTPDELRRDRLAGSRLAAPTNRSTSRTCRCVFTLGSPSWACWSLWCVSTASEKRWKLEFSVREEA